MLILMTCLLGLAIKQYREFRDQSVTMYLPNPLISVLDNFDLSQQKSEYLLLTLEHFLKKALLEV